MSDFERQLAALRADANQEISADGLWAEITIPAHVLVELLDRLQAPRPSPHPQTPLRT